MKITKQLTKKYCHFVVFSLALALAAPFLSCRSGGGGSDDPPKNPGNGGGVTDDHGNDLANATPVTSGMAVEGNIETGDDQDWFSIEVSGAGQIQASTTGTTNTIGTLYDGEGNELAMDDDGGADTSFDISHDVPDAGTYYLRVTSEGTGTGTYSVTVTFIPDDHGNDQASAAPVTSGMAVEGNIEPGDDEDWFSIEASRAGQIKASTTGTTNTIGTLFNSRGDELTTDDDSGADTNFAISYDLMDAGTYYLRVTSSGSETGMYSLTITFDDHGNDRTRATPVTSGMAVAGNIETGDDQDWFSIEASGVGQIRASTTGTTNTIGALYDSDGNELATDDDGGADTNFSISHDVTDAGTYYIRVTSSGTGTGMYSLTATFDHGNDPASATLVENVAVVSANITSTDEDWFSVKVSEPGILSAYTTGRVDTVGEVYDSIGNQLAMNDDNRSDINFSVFTRITTSSTYYIKVTSKGAGEYALTIVFTPDDHGNDRDSATQVMSGVPEPGEIEIVGDQDWFSIQVSGVGTLVATTTGMTDTRGIVFDSNGKRLAVNEDGGMDTNFDARARIARSGTYYIRLSGSSAGTGMYSLTVTLVPDDHGNDAGSATPIRSGMVVAGNIEMDDDEDWFSIKLAPKTNLARLRATTTGDTDTIGELYDTTGNRVLAMNDDGGMDMNFDFLQSIVFDGTYFIRVRSKNSDTGAYRLTAIFISDDHGNDRTSATAVTSGTAVAGNIEMGGDQDWFSIQVSLMNDDVATLSAITTGSTDTRGVLYDSNGNRLAADDDGGMGTNFSAVARIDTSDTYYVRVVSKDSGTGGYSLTVTSLTVTSKSGDHGDTSDTATEVTIDSAISGNIDTRSDKDYFTFTVPENGRVTISTTGNLDTRGTLLNSDGSQLGFDNDSGIDKNFSISTRISGPKTYFLQVNAYTARTGTGAYTLSITFIRGFGYSRFGRGGF